MPQIQFNSTNYQCEREESVLDCLLRHNLDVPHACKKGTCHSCKMQALSGNVCEESQRGLKDTEIALGYFLPCSCKPTTDMVVAIPADSQANFECEVLDKAVLTKDVMRLRLSRPQDFEYRAGQFINLYKTESLSRSYSLASVAGQDEFLEFHIKLLPNGQVSSWVHNDLSIGDTVKISDAKGESFYINDDLHKNILLIGTGTGLAPLYGVVRDALFQGHKGAMYLYHGSREEDGLYLVEELRELSNQHPNFFYKPCVSGQGGGRSVAQGRASDLALAEHKDLKDWRVFLCGNPNMIEKTKLKTYLAGASLNDILTDPFLVGDSNQSS